MEIIMWLSVMIPVRIVLIKMVQKRRNYKNADYSPDHGCSNRNIISYNTKFTLTINLSIIYNKI